MKQKIRYYILSFCCIAGITVSMAQAKQIVDYVNPLIGTAPSTTISALKHGLHKENNAQVVPFVTAPFGMTNWTPQTQSTEIKCQAPYYYTDSIITGFRGSHWLSGSCVQDYGSMTIMPISGPLKCLPDERGSKFSHATEVARPYSYEVTLSDYNIDVEMTATKRSGFIKFRFNTAGEGHMVVHPNSDEGEGYVRVDTTNNEIIGYNPVHRIYQGWGEQAGFSGYFVVRFDKAIKAFGTYQNDHIYSGKAEISDQENLGAYISFNTVPDETIHAFIGTSFTSIENARKNLDAEVGMKTMADVKVQLMREWEQLLSKIKVEGQSEDAKAVFYTALYHSFLHPRTFNDVDGAYTGFAGTATTKTLNDTDYFVDFSMWDTFRASHPLFNLLTPSISADMVRSLFSKAEQGGWLPIFPCWNSYTSAMIGDHVIATVADAYVKGIIDLSSEQYKYLLKNAFESPLSYTDYKNGKGRRALEPYLKYGYIPLEEEVKESFHTNEQVSRTLEYAFDDFALSQIAQKMGDKKHFKLLRERALNYRKVYSQKDSTVRGRYADGTFIDDFDKYVRQPYITEGTPYQYTWFVPHDVQGLMDLMGGQKAFNDNLDRFHAKGQYWHGNEPGHQIPFLYNYSGEPWKTQEVVKQIMQTEYSNDIGGLSGNDDAGQMSAWYVFAAMGFYPVAPSVPEYVISGPHFDRISIDLENGKTLIINAKGASSGHNYIQQVRINGSPYNKTFLSHFDFLKGGVIDFEMGPAPNKTWGSKYKSRPFSMSN